MTVFDAIRSLLGLGARVRLADGFVAGHEDHWGALLPEENRAETIEALTKRAVTEGEELEGEPLDGGEVTGYHWQDGRLGTFAITVDGEVVTAFPVAEGADHHFDARALDEDESGIEARVVGGLGDVKLSAFASNYVQFPKPHFGGRLEVSLAIVLYDLARVPEETIEEGAKPNTSEFAGVRGWERGGPADVVVRTAVEHVETVSLGEAEVYRVYAPLFRTSRGQYVDGDCYVGAGHVAKPEIGDTVEGTGWLQAWVH